MLVPAMNEMEVYKEIIDDGVSVFKTVDAKIRLQLMIMKRKNNFNWVETIHIKTSRNNHWSVYLNFRNAMHETNMYVMAEGKYGIEAYNFIMVEKIPTLVKYTSHFFKRYRERMQTDEIKPQQIIKRFFRNNINIIPAFSEEEENGQIMAGIRLPEGIGLGRFSGISPITEMKTFIPNHLLNKNQQAFAKDLEEDENYMQGISLIGMK